MSCNIVGSNAYPNPPNSLALEELPTNSFWCMMLSIVLHDCLCSSPHLFLFSSMRGFVQLCSGTCEHDVCMLPAARVLTSIVQLAVPPSALFALPSCSLPLRPAFSSMPWVRLVHTYGQTNAIPVPPMSFGFVCQHSVSAYGNCRAATAFCCIRCGRHSTKKLHFVL